MVKSKMIKISLLAHYRKDVLHPCNINYLPLYLYNILLWTFSFLALSLSLFSLIVEAFEYQDSQLEIIMLVLIFTGIVCATLTFLTSAIFNFALVRNNTSLVQSSRVLFSWSSFIDMYMFLFGILVLLRFNYLFHDMVDWAKFIQYYQEAQIRDDLDAIQRGLKCCGFNSYEDWDLNPYYSCNSTGYSRCSVPFSCCRRGHVDSECVLGIRDRQTKDIHQFIYTEGCLKTSQDWYFYTVILLSAVAFYQALLKWIISFYIRSFLREGIQANIP